MGGMGGLIMRHVPGLVSALVVLMGDGPAEREETPAHARIAKWMASSTD